MKKAIYLTFLLFNIFACSQNKKEINMTNQDTITLENYKDKMLSEIKHYPQEPLYYVYVHNNLCLYEMLVNDYPIEKRFEYSTSGTPFYINTAILKSGKQKLTFRMYPAPKEYNGGSDVLDQYASLSFKIYVNDNATGLKMANEKLVLEGEAKQINYEDSSQKYFEGKGKKYYEFSVEFDAQVPYNLEGWTTGEDLRKFDQKKLEEKTFEIYQQFKNNYNEANLDKIINKVYLSILGDGIPEYYKKEEIAQQWKESFELIQMEKDWYPWNYKVQYYGDGRIIALLQKDESIDYLRNISSIAFKYKEGDEEGMAYTYLYLYIPKGGTIDDLQVLR